MKYFKKLVGDRIYLSPRSTEDAEIFVKWLNDFEVSDYTGRTNMIMTLDAEKKYLEDKALDSSTVAFAIVNMADDTMIGTVSIENINHINRTGVLGILIGNPDFRSKGYGTEAIRLILDFGFNYLNLGSIRLDLLSCNERALKCYKKCGFKEYGRWRKSKFINGKYYDTISMDILSEEFTDTYIRNKNVK